MSEDTQPDDLRIYDEEKPLRAFTDEMREEAKELLNAIGGLPEDMRKKAENTAWRFKEETGAMLESIGMMTWPGDAKAIKEAERGLVTLMIPSSIDTTSACGTKSPQAGQTKSARSPAGAYPLAAQPVLSRQGPTGGEKG